MKYIRNSQFRFAFDLNPFFWGFYFFKEPPTKHCPKNWAFGLKILFISFFLMIDDGTFIVEKHE